MRKVVRVISAILIFTMVFASVGAFASSYSEVGEQNTRIREYLKVKVPDTGKGYTEFYQDTPPGNITIAYLVNGDKLILQSTYTDADGNLWFYAKLAYCPRATYLEGAYGYVLASHVVDVYE